jgi:hypothetical protein
MLRNNQIDMFQEYFIGEESDHVVENISTKTLMLLKFIFCYLEIRRMFARGVSVKYRGMLKDLTDWQYPTRFQGFNKPLTK